MLGIRQIKSSCSCLDCLTGFAGPTEKWLLMLPKGGTVLCGSCFMKESARNSTGHRRKHLTNCQVGRTVFEIFGFMKKWTRYYGPIGWWWVPAMLQKSFGWLFRQLYVSVNFKVLKVAYNALPVYLGNIIIFFWSL